MAKKAKRKTRAKTGKSAKRASRKKPTKAKKVARASKAKATKAKRSPAKPRRAKTAKVKTVRRAAARRVKRSTTALRAGVARAAVGGRVEALRSKLDAIEALEIALRAQRTNTPADEIELNPNLDSLRNERRVVEAQIAAALAAPLPPPSEADVMALRQAIREAEDVIARTAAVNRLIEAATALIKTLRA